MIKSCWGKVNGIEILVIKRSNDRKKTTPSWRKMGKVANRRKRFRKLKSVLLTVIVRYAINCPQTSVSTYKTKSCSQSLHIASPSHNLTLRILLTLILTIFGKPCLMGEVSRWYTEHIVYHRKRVTLCCCWMHEVLPYPRISWVDFYITKAEFLKDTSKTMQTVMVKEQQFAEISNW